MNREILSLSCDCVTHTALSKSSAECGDAQLGRQMFLGDLA